jgi:hypothetical protein
MVPAVKWGVPVTWWRFDCAKKCTTYEIADELKEQILADKREAETEPRYPDSDDPGERMRYQEATERYQIARDRCFHYYVYLSDDASRATHVPRKDRQHASAAATAQDVLKACLKLENMEDVLDAANRESSFRDCVRPVLNYLEAKKIDVLQKACHSPYVYLELALYEGHRVTLKVDESLFVDWSPKELEEYCHEYKVAEELKKAPGGIFEIPKMRPPRRQGEA